MIYDIDPTPAPGPRIPHYDISGGVPSRSVPEAPALTRREIRKIERAHEYLNLHSKSVNSFTEYKNTHPGEPIMGAVDKDGVMLSENNASERSGRKPVDISDQLDEQRAVIAAHKEKIHEGDVDTINALNNKWLEMQPLEERVEGAAAETYLKIGKFVTRVFNTAQPIMPIDEFAAQLHEAAHRQSWMNDEVMKRAAVKENAQERKAMKDSFRN